MRILPTAFLGCLLSLACFGQKPVIVDTPRNAGSYAEASLANGSIAQGSMFVLKGQPFGQCNNNNTVIANAFPLNTVMRNVQVRINMAGQTYNALMIYVAVCLGNKPDQLAAILPSNVPVGTGTIQVVFTNTNQISDPKPIKVVARSFGVFTWNQAGRGPIIVQNFVNSTTTPTNGLFQAANPGQVGIIWGVGLGAVSPSSEIAGPVPGDMPINVDVYVGGKKATVTYRGRSGCCAGIDQIVFNVPTGLDGCYVSVAVVVDGILSNVGTMSIASSGTTCVEATRFAAADLAKLSKSGALNIGDIQVSRLNISAGAIQGSVDQADGAFHRYSSTAELMAAGPQSLVGMQGTVSPGSCLVTADGFNSDTPLDALFPDYQDPMGLQLDAGANLQFSNAKGNKQLPKQLLMNGSIDGYYLPDGQFLGGGVPAAGINAGPAFLDPGAITVTAPGGSGAASVGAISASLTIPSTFATWSNQAAINTVPRNQDLTINWTGGAAGELVVIGGSSADNGVGAKAGFICVERATAGTFTVPAYLMSTMPASGTLSGLRVGWLVFGAALAQPTRFNAAGLDVGYFNWINATAKNVNFQ